MPEVKERPRKVGHSRSITLQGSCYEAAL
jgi:hypothetical protein